MPGARFLRGETVVLRTVEEEDLPFLRDTINDPAVRQWLDQTDPINLAQEREFFEHAVTGDDDTLNLTVWAEGERVGTIGAEFADGPADAAELGLFLAPDYWGEGYGTEASRLVTDWAFRERGVHRVSARVFEGNEASRRIWERLGFEHEATYRENHFRDGEYVDTHRFAVLAQEWLD